MFYPFILSVKPRIINILIEVVGSGATWGKLEKSYIFFSQEKNFKISLQGITRKK